ncbi:hypothetical protein NCCP2716_27460 [Sporosarcina sp. NCCP-2716]|uniref:YopX family protein n=1 Tax=Sporosarcina sp. NCCP-2716 TaxID=2943679 RepID=UPI00203E42F3|nr:YopX family protein [Sporosarcina sp. NCCP-2716]GKV70248.1 hypothetical protein NCCP2716_27460 [Sporosarcina sp. NCCP-2716]
MREIKFRAWEESEKRMYADIQKGIWEDPDDWLYFGDILGLERFKVMQYTGLKDKNGREIYEGDIIICRKYIDGNIVEYTRERGYVNCAFGAFGLHRKQGYYRPFKDWLEDYEFEVIGNIHDNPGLLEVAE